MRPRTRLLLKFVEAVLLPPLRHLLIAQAHAHVHAQLLCHLPGLLGPWRVAAGRGATVELLRVRGAVCGRRAASPRRHPPGCLRRLAPDDRSVLAQIRVWCLAQLARAAISPLHCCPGLRRVHSAATGRDALLQVQLDDFCRTRCLRCLTNCDHRPFADSRPTTSLVCARWWRSIPKIESVSLHNKALSLEGGAGHLTDARVHSHSCRRPKPPSGRAGTRKRPPALQARLQ